MISIGNKIKELRIKKGMTQSELCKNFINRTVLSRIENNKMTPSISQLEYFSKKLNVPLRYFLSDDGFMHNSDRAETDNLSYIKEMFEKGYYYDTIKETKRIAEKCDNTSNIILYYFQGMSYFNLNIFTDSQRVLKKLINLYLKSDEETQRRYIFEFSKALNSLFKIMIKSENYEKGKKYLFLARKYLYKYNKTDSLMNFIIHSNLGFAYNETSQYSDTINILETFLSGITNIIYKNIMPDIHMSLNIAYYNLEKYRESIDHIKKSIFFYSYIGNVSQTNICYLNYINALRYSGNFQEAFSVLDTALESTKNDIQMFSRLLVQKSILLFNLERYDECLEVIESIKTSMLKNQSKMNINFMMGHIGFLKGNSDVSAGYLMNCEKFFISRKYFKDLSLLYKDVFLITDDERYNIKSRECLMKKARKNILI